MSIFFLDSIPYIASILKVMWNWRDLSPELVTMRKPPLLELPMDVRLSFSPIRVAVT